MGTLKGRKILITGATSGIGKAIAIKLILEDAKVILTGRNLDAMKELKRLSNEKTQASIYEADLGKSQQVYKLLKGLKENGDIPDSLIHSAGLFKFGSIEDTSDDMLLDCLQINFIAPFMLTRDWLQIRPQTRGAVIFINSTVALMPKSGVFAYAASKSALKSLADSLCEESGTSRVRVSTIYPGRVATPMQEKVCELDGSTYNTDRFIAPEIIVDEVLRLLTLPANAEIRDLVIRQPRV
ncbi:MAG: SDR family NAD(P)-dependent oxidoreductase [Gammaproteobacteria bacterium]|nr:SDR family NAD(P)-dependent oxidoreductase [Gammaproteobacteria bacterium]